MPDHPTGNPDLIHQHKVLQRQGDQELNGAETKGKDLPDAVGGDEREAGIVIPDDGSKKHLPKMKPATDHDVEGESGGEGSTGAGANQGP